MHHSVAASPWRFSQNWTNALASALAGICTAVLSGCASVGSTKPRTDLNLPYPTAFYVQDFSVNLASASWDAEATNRAEYLASFADISRRLSARLRTELMDIAPVHVLKPADPRPKDGYIIEGDFLRMNAGHPALRAVPGLGLGQTRLVANARMYLASSRRQPFARMDTKNIGREYDARTMGISQEGLVMGINSHAGSGLVSGLPGAYHRQTDDAEAMAREISHRIREVLGLAKK